MRRSSTIVGAATKSRHALEWIGGGEIHIARISRQQERIILIMIDSMMEGVMMMMMMMVCSGRSKRQKMAIKRRSRGI